MATFSERMGLTQLNRPIQLDGIDKPLLNRLWNMYDLHILEELKPLNGNREGFNLYRLLIWDSLFKETIDSAPRTHEDLRKRIKFYFFTKSWYEIYNLIDFTSKVVKFDTNRFVDGVNWVLENEYSGYRFINGLIAPISNSIESETIIEALSNTQHTFDGRANIHLNSALKSISDKPNPDYRNSIKESISAIGTVLRKITGKSTFGDALKHLDSSGLKINSQFKEGLNKFYNYTNDAASGIRHEIVNAPQPPDFETAKFMLLTCSAFINYIIPLVQKANIKV